MSGVSGTYIKEYDENMEENIITGLSICDDSLMVTISQIPDQIENIALIFEKIAQENVNVDMISQTSPLSGFISLSFTAPKDDLFIIEKLMSELNQGLECSIEQEMTKISVVGIGMRNQSGVSGRLFIFLADHGIKFKQVTTSEISISYMIDTKYKETAVSILSKELNL